MRKTIIISVISGLVLATVVISLSLSKSQKTTSPINNQTSTVTPTTPISQTKLMDYIDSSGFKFSYPNSLKIKPANSNNPKIYSQLTLNSDKFPGSINLKVEDTVLNSLDSWLKNNKTGSAESEIKDLKLADLKAKEIQTTGKITTAALDQGTLFTIDVNFEENKDYWIEVYQKLVSSFAFIVPTSAPVSNIGQSDNPSSEEDVIDEGEEVVE